MHQDLRDFIKVRRRVAQAGIGQNGLKSVIVMLRVLGMAMLGVFSLKLASFTFSQDTVMYMEPATRNSKRQLTRQLIKHGDLGRLSSLLSPKPAGVICSASFLQRKELGSKEEVSRHEHV